MLVTVAAETYLNGTHTEPTEAEKECFLHWLAEEYKKIQAKVRYTYQEVDPAQFLLRHQNTGHLLISTAHSEHPWLTKKQNAHFRAVHDSHHLAMGLGFDIVGEYMAFEYAASIAPQAIHWILRSEIWYQAAAQVHTGTFQEQKCVK